MKVVDLLVDRIIGTFNDSMDLKSIRIKAEFSLEIHRVATTAFAHGIEAGIRMEAARMIKFAEDNPIPDFTNPSESENG